MFIEENSNLSNDVILNNETIKQKKRISLNICISTVCMIIIGLFLLFLSIYIYFNSIHHEGFITLLIISVIILLLGFYSLYMICSIKYGFKNQDSKFQYYEYL